MKKILTVFLAVALLCACAVPAEAAQSAQTETVHASLWQGRVWIENEQMAFLNEQGGRVSLFSYNGTVYIPVRTAGEWMGCTVGWDQATQTVSLTGHGDAVYHKVGDQRAGTDEELAALLEEREKGMSIQLRPDLSVVVDGVKQSFTNVKGEAVYPAVYKGVTYLPVRNIGELCGKEVAWVPGAMEAIYLYEPLTDAQQTQLDIFYATQKQHYALLKAVVEPLTSDELAADDRMLDLLGSARNYLQAMQQVSRPEVPVVQTYVQYIMDTANDMELYVDGCLARIENGATLQELKSDFQFDQDMTMWFGNIRGELDAFKVLLDAL